MTAILTALMDQDIRRTVLGITPDLRGANFVEATAEDLSDGIRRVLGSFHPSAKPRRALNDFQWQLPRLLPNSGGPDVLTAEVHSFARVISGCVYNTLVNIFDSRPNHDEVALLEAAQTTGRLMVEAVRVAPVEARYFRSIGRTMILVDAQQNGGANHLAIRDAFSSHNIALGSSSMLAPTAILAGRAPSMNIANGKARLGKSTLAELSQWVGVKKAAKFTLNAVRIGGHEVVEAVTDHLVRLDSLDTRLSGVIALAPASVLIGADHARASILGAVPNLRGSVGDVEQFVQTLLDNDCIQFKKTKSIISDKTKRMRTHVVKKVGSKKVLQRVAFDCFPGCNCASESGSGSRRPASQNRYGTR
jgi:hypothetical protein